MNQPFVYFSKMFQAVPQLMEVHKFAGGVFVSNRRSTLDAVHKLYPDVELARYRSWFKQYNAGFKAMKTASAIITGAPTPVILSEFSAVKAMVFHGTYMLLSKSSLQQLDHFDLLCTIGPRMRKTIDRYRDELQLKQVVESGYLPFGSFPEKSATLTQANLTRLGLSPQKKTVVYMPWGKPHGSWLQMAERIVRETPREFNLILRPHPSQGLTARREDLASFKRVFALCAERPHTLLDINTSPLSQLFSLADLMVTDGTSPAEESLFYDVPQLFIQTPLWSEDVIRAHAEKNHIPEDEITEYLDLFKCGTSFDIRRDTDFSQAVHAATESGASLQTQRQAYFNWIFGLRDRQAGTRVQQAVLNLINSSAATTSLPR